MSKILIDTYQIDAVLSESHSYDADITDHPVETGSDITDNVRLRPVVVTLNGIVSDTPLGDVARVRGVSLPTDDALVRILGIRDARKTVTIQTLLKTYDDMMLQSFHVPVDSKTGASLVFTATFKQILLVQNVSQTVLVAIPPAKKKENLGNKSSAEADEPPAGYYNPNNPEGADTSVLGLIVDQAGKTTKIVGKNF